MLYYKDMDKTTKPMAARSNFYLRVNGIAATFLRTKKQCLKMAELGHEDRPDAIVELVEFDVVTNIDTVISRLYN